jgi:hypothetical protein
MNIVKTQHTVICFLTAVLFQQSLKIYQNNSQADVYMDILQQQKTILFLKTHKSKVVSKFETRKR